MTKNFEYKKVSEGDFDLEKLGNEGWEMCGIEKYYVLGFCIGTDYYFKREK